MQPLPRLHALNHCMQTSKQVYCNVCLTEASTLPNPPHSSPPPPSPVPPFPAPPSPARTTPPTSPPRPPPGQSQLPPALIRDTPQPTTPGPRTSPTTEASSRNNTGLIVGVAVGASVVAALLAGLTVFLVVRNRRAKPEALSPSAQGPEDTDQKHTEKTDSDDGLTLPDTGPRRQTGMGKGVDALHQPGLPADGMVVIAVSDTEKPLQGGPASQTGTSATIGSSVTSGTSGSRAVQSKSGAVSASGSGSGAGSGSGVRLSKGPKSGGSLPGSVESDARKLSSNGASSMLLGSAGNPESYAVYQVRCMEYTCMHLRAHMYTYSKCNYALTAGACPCCTDCTSRMPWWSTSLQTGNTHGLRSSLPCHTAHIEIART